MTRFARPDNPGNYLVLLCALFYAMGFFSGAGFAYRDMREAMKKAPEEIPTPPPAPMLKHHSTRLIDHRGPTR